MFWFFDNLGTGELESLARASGYARLDISTLEIASDEPDVATRSPLPVATDEARGPYSTIVLVNGHEESERDRRPVPGMPQWATPLCGTLAANLSPSGTIFVVDLPPRLPYFGLDLERRGFTFKYWYAVQWLADDLGTPGASGAASANPWDGALPTVHLGILHYVRNKKRFHIYKVRTPHQYCRFCGEPLADWGGKKASRNPAGRVISDVWLQLATWPARGEWQREILRRLFSLAVVPGTPVLVVLVKELAKEAGRALSVSTCTGTGLGQERSGLEPGGGAKGSGSGDGAEDSGLGAGVAGSGPGAGAQASGLGAQDDGPGPSLGAKGSGLVEPIPGVGAGSGAGVTANGRAKGEALTVPTLSYRALESERRLDLELAPTLSLKPGPGPGLDPDLQPEPQPLLPDTLRDTLLQGDILEVISRVPSHSVDLAFADPPYNLDKHYGHYDDDRHDEEYLTWCNRWLAEYARILKPGGCLFVLNLPKWAVHHAAFLDRHDGLCRQNWIVWDALSEPRGRVMPAHYSILFYTKGSRPAHFHPERARVEARGGCFRARCLNERRRGVDPILAEGRLDDIWHDVHRIRHRRDRDAHPCQLPLRLVERIVSIASEPGDLVFDGFMGTGSTALAARKLGRHYLGIEIDPAYIRIARAKLNDVDSFNAVGGLGPLFEYQAIR